MIVTRTPYRISLFGGGSDHRAHYEQHGGAVLGFTINKFCYVSLRELPPFFAHKHRIVYSRIELPQILEEIQHPAVRAILMDQKVEGGVEVQTWSDLPHMSGMGSSSAFTVGLINAVWRGVGNDRELAVEGMRIEQEVMKEAVGSQDQIWAAYGGGPRLLEFDKDSFTVKRSELPDSRIDELESHLLLFFTGLSRQSTTIEKAKIENVERNYRKLGEMVSMAYEGRDILQSDRIPLSHIGKLLRGAWRRKKELASAVTNPMVDGIVDAAESAGAIGCKLLGAGGGGFMLIFAAPEHHAKIRERLAALVEVQFKIGSEGSRVVMRSD